jgi:hypothetical protein
MDAGTAKRLAKDWVTARLAEWPGLQAAHLVGGLATMPDEAPFPVYKDVDIRLVFAEGSPALQPTGPFVNIIETEHAGLLIEAGVRSAREYTSAEAVLGNPEIAYHLTVPSTLYDPHRLLAGLAEPVRRGYRQRRWMRARVAFERAGLDGALARLPMARAHGGLASAILLLGYSCLYAGAAVQVAALRPPRIGSQLFLHLRGLLAEYGRSDLYEVILGVFGIQAATPERVEVLLVEGAALFDQAVGVRRTPHPFQHKLHAHLRPYFVASCRAMLDVGEHREALAWLTAFYLACSDVLVADGPERERPAHAARCAAFLAELGFDGAATFDARLAQARAAQEACFALADELVATHPDVMDAA